MSKYGAPELRPRRPVKRARRLDREGGSAASGGHRVQLALGPLAAWLAILAALVFVVLPGRPVLEQQAVPAFAPLNGSGGIEAPAAAPTAREPGWWDQLRSRRPDVSTFKSILGLAIPGLSAVDPPPSALMTGDITFQSLLQRFFETAGGVTLGRPWTLLAAELPALRIVEMPDHAAPLIIRGPVALLPDYRPGDWVDRRPPANGIADGAAPNTDGPAPGDPSGSDAAGAADPDWTPPEGDPLVLIYHSHGTEAFLGAIPTGSSMNPNVDGFTPDPEQNVIRVGLKMRQVLEEEFGLNVLHVADLFDWEQGRVTRIGSYFRSLQMLETFQDSGRPVMEQYPSIRVALDVHRDAVPREQSLLRMDDGDLARLLFIVGTRERDHPDWRTNLCFATTLHGLAEEMQPGLSRGIQRHRERLNQHIVGGAVLIEIGSVENTLTEALRSADFVARLIHEAFSRGLVPEPGEPYSCPS
ncbi:MAG: stage II sporulation protein P [Thermaerobacterales bacterium]